tara:strand:+ start:81 stop:377 length:297 start_codon:yes stop_codon:yes gene_type:complete
MDTLITNENVSDYPVGTTVEFFFGAYFPRPEGVITGFVVVPKTEWNDEQVKLTAEYVDWQTDEVVPTTVSMFSETGIGVYLLEVAEQKVNKKSPWVYS